MEQLKDRLSELYHELPPWGKATAAAAFGLAIYIPYKYYTSKPRKSPIKEDFQKGVVYLYQFPRFKYIPSVSPFCLKLETWLRMADIHYENVDAGWSVRSCEGTLPFLEYNGREYPDSSLAIRDMTVIFSKESMESHLNEEQRSASRAFEKLAECSLMMAIGLLRYTENIGEMASQLPEKAFGVFTPLITWFMQRSVPSQVAAITKLMGIGKHSRQEVINISTDDLRAISNYLGSKHYFTGFKPTRVDATLFGVLAQVVYAPYEIPQKKLILEEMTNLKEYCDRIKGRYWPDWDECTTKFTLNSDWKKKV